MTARVIDTETTSSDPKEAKIVSIASIDLDRDGGFSNPLDVLCDPQCPIPPEASAVNHIIDDDVRGRPLFREIIDRFGGADVYIAHNAAYDRALLDEALGHPKWICTMKVAYRVWPDAPGFSNQALRYWRKLIEPLGVARKSVLPHDALSDVFVTGAVFLELAKEAKFSDMVAWTDEPALLIKCNFGTKHKGRLYSEIAKDDRGYLEWLAYKSEMNDDVKYTARHWLEAKC